MNALVEAKEKINEIAAKQAVEWAEKYPSLAVRNIDEATWNALSNSLYPGAKFESVMMAWDYCKARQLDPLQKPVHLVPMSVKDSVTGKYIWRDVVMPGIGMYRIQADRSKMHAGTLEPEFGPTITTNFGGVNVSYPEWCKITVKKIVGNQIFDFVATEFWIENYATKKDSSIPNAMWGKRPFGQLAKCAEAQALRKAFPNIVSQEPTFEEMEGKEFFDSHNNQQPNSKQSLKTLKSLNSIMSDSEDTENEIFEDRIIESSQITDKVFNEMVASATSADDFVELLSIVDTRARHKQVMTKMSNMFDSNDKDFEILANANKESIKKIVENEDNISTDKGCL